MRFLLELKKTGIRIDESLEIEQASCGPLGEETHARRLEASGRDIFRLLVNG